MGPEWGQGSTRKRGFSAQPHGALGRFARARIRQGAHAQMRDDYGMQMQIADARLVTSRL